MWSDLINVYKKNELQSMWNTHRGGTINDKKVDGNLTKNALQSDLWTLKLHLFINESSVRQQYPNTYPNKAAL